MATIKELIARVDDQTLRADLDKAATALLKSKNFGLVFEDHLPEYVPLWDVPVKRGGLVALKPRVGEKIEKLYRVATLSNGLAKCVDQTSKEICEFSTDRIISVASFKEPIYPQLVPMDVVENNPQDDLWHTLIQADNYHALQLLQYLYPKQVDCIYIDPPYNTGARVWKYNNDYVDKNDNFSSSRWLSMMSKRLEIAKEILKDDGVLIVTIDDNEQAHLWMLLQKIFRDRKLFSIAIQHNPRGTQGDKFAVSHETAIYVLGKDSKIYRKTHKGDDESNFRKWGNQSERSRTARATTFYPVIVDQELNICGFGEVEALDFHPDSANFNIDGNIYVYPVDGNGIERKWRYSKNNEQEVLPFLTARRNDDGIIEIFIQRESENTLTVWTNPLYNAEEYGTKLINKIVKSEFPFPKSIYAEHDSIWHAVAGKPNALIVDFFAGSGTTLNAVNLINAEDGGHRRCILVTNNEVSEKESLEFQRQGLYPGDLEWETHGICQSVTWPRTKYTINGCRDDGTELEGEYFTNLYASKEIARSFSHIGFIENPVQLTVTQKKQLLSVCAKGSLPQSLVTNETKYVISDNEKHTASILFDDSYFNEWLEAIEGMDHITHFFIVTKKTRDFNRMKTDINVKLGNVVVAEPIKWPLKKGFKTNCEYFKLGFLDKQQVELGKSFKAILPILWLQSGAVGKRPVIDEDELPEMFIPDGSSFAVLLDESAFREFKATIDHHEGIKYVYIVTNSKTAFTEMSSQLSVPQVKQLYSSYIDNFVLNARRNLQ